MLNKAHHRFGGVVGGEEDAQLGDVAKECEAVRALDSKAAGVEYEVATVGVDVEGLLGNLDR